MTTYRLRTLAVFFVIFWVPLIIFFKVAGEILENEPMRLDVTILEWIHNHATPFYDNFFLVVTTLGNVEIVIPVVLLTTGYLVYKKYHQAAMILFFSILGGAAANFILKMLFHRDRPSIWHTLIVENSFSFPSGHAMLTSALAFSFVLIAWKTRFRWPVVVIGVTYVVLIGLSRLYLGVHYPTDIIAGWSVSIVWTLIVFLIVRGDIVTFDRLKTIFRKK